MALWPLPFVPPPGDRESSALQSPLPSFTCRAWRAPASASFGGEGRRKIPPDCCGRHPGLGCSAGEGASRSSKSRSPTTGLGRLPPGAPPQPLPSRVGGPWTCGRPRGPGWGARRAGPPASHKRSAQSPGPPRVPASAHAHGWAGPREGAGRASSPAAALPRQQTGRGACPGRTCR